MRESATMPALQKAHVSGGNELSNSSSSSNRLQHLLIAAAAAFCTYFCMYAFRKPFTAATFDGATWGSLSLKATLVVSQLLGYMLSKFIGIKVVSELPAKYRALGILLLIGVAELALVGFAILPVPLKIVAIFINGLPLGMVFGLVLAYLEGRQQTEALSAALCASFIVSSGYVKTFGAWLIQDVGIDEFVMPSLVGLAFLPPLFVSVWFLQRTPPPDIEDIALRRERKTMSGKERLSFIRSYFPGLALLIYVYIALTIVRTLRDDFGVEIWRDLGVGDKPSIFATTESIVAIIVVAFNALMIWVRSNLAALRLAISLIAFSFLVIVLSTIAQDRGVVSPLLFMVACGIGLYIPYVAFHTTMFERLIASLDKPANLGFLMYLADAMGYLGYAVIVIVKTSTSEIPTFLPFFRTALIWGSCSSVVAMVLALLYFQRKIRQISTDGPNASDGTSDTPLRPSV